MIAPESCVQSVGADVVEPKREAVHAAASVASVLLTLVLVWVTARYVRLTKDLAEVAREQLRHQQQSAASDAARLLTLIDVFGLALRRLPDADARGEQIRDVALWKHSDVSAFASLAPAVLGPEAHLHRTIEELNWIRATADQVQQTKREVGFRWNEFPWSQWKEILAKARGDLERLHEELVQRIKPHEPS